jgi:small subunit ribosomal protein S10
MSKVALEKDKLRIDGRNMVRKARIRLTSTDYQKLEDVCNELKSIAQKTGVKINGPVPLPTKRLKVPVLKAPSGEGTATWDRWEMRIHKRLIEIDSEERVMRRIMRIRVPEEVHVTIELI